MKSYIQNLSMLSAVITFASCTSKKTAPNEEAVSKSEVHSEAYDSLLQPPKIPKETKSIEGIVKATTSGKDGFSATILTNENELFQVIVSIPNLNDPKQYRRFNTNEIVKLYGDFWTMNGEKQLTVREIH